MTVAQQGLDNVKDQLFNPLKNLVFGGSLSGSGMKPAGTITGRYKDTDFNGWKLASTSSSRKHEILIHLHIDYSEDPKSWHSGLASLQQEAATSAKTAQATTQSWWHQFWDRSFVFINNSQQTQEWQVGRNYQLFRYMLACNALGKYPTKFNGGLFTVDPSLTDSSLRFTI